MIKNKLNVSSSPHLHCGVTTTSLMLDVIIALAPAFIMSFVLFGPRALLLTAISVASCVLFEYFSRKIFKRSNTTGDLSAVVTGLLLAFNLPVTLPWWMVIIICGDSGRKAVVRRHRTEFCKSGACRPYHPYDILPRRNVKLGRTV